MAYIMCIVTMSMQNRHWDSDDKNCAKFHDDQDVMTTKSQIKQSTCIPRGGQDFETCQSTQCEVLRSNSSSVAIANVKLVAALLQQVREHDHDLECNTL